MATIPTDLKDAAQKVYDETHREFMAWVPYRGEPDVFDQMERAMLAERRRIADALETGWTSDMSFPEALAIIENRK